MFLRRKTAGAAIVQQPCSAGNQAQNWAPVNTAGSTYEFVNQVSGMCLDARGGAAVHTPIQQWPCANISNEHWTWTHSFPRRFLAAALAGRRPQRLLPGRARRLRPGRAGRPALHRQRHPRSGLGHRGAGLLMASLLTTSLLMNP